MSQKPKAGNIAALGCLSIVVLFIVVVVIAVATSDSDSDDKPDAKDTRPTTSTTPTATTPPGMDKRQITELSVDMVWDNYSAARRDLLCVGVETNGPGWFAEQMQSDNIDPDYAAELVKEKCESR